MDKLAILRSAYHTNAGHGMGSQWMLTGYQPTIEVTTTSTRRAARSSRRCAGPNEPGLPAYVNVRDTSASARRLFGASYNPFARMTIRIRRTSAFRNVRLPAQVDAGRLHRRRELMQDLDNIRRDIDTRATLIGLDTF